MLQGSGFAIFVIAGLLVTACATTPAPSETGSATATATGSGAAAPTTTPLPTPTAIASPSPVAGGCGATQVFAGPGPDAGIGLGDNPWASASPAAAGIVAYFWLPPPDLIFAQGPRDPDGTKVLWVSHDAEGERRTIAEQLTVVAHPLDAASPVVRASFPAATSPGGNYPSSLDLPSAGCWRLELALGSLDATLDVMVAPARP